MFRPTQNCAKYAQQTGVLSSSSSVKLTRCYV